MKRNNTLLKSLLVLISLSLASCNLLPTMSPTSRRKRSSQEDNDSEIVERSSSEEQSTSSVRPCRNHTWSEWETVTAPTCTEYGTAERYCKVCGERQNKKISPSHYWGEWYLYRDATCVETGTERRECTVCHMLEERTIPMTDHTWGEWEMIQEVSCISTGYQRHTCLVCGFEEIDTLYPSGHLYDENNVDWTQRATCTQDGYGYSTCLICGQRISVSQAMLDHDYILIGDIEEPAPGEAITNVYRCTRCNDIQMSFRAIDVTEASKQRLVYYQNNNGELGAKFWGRSIGNAQALDMNGVSVNQHNNEVVYCSSETGDYFEYVFTLTAEEANILSTCRLYCDATPADYLNGTDFWAYGNSNTDWTPGYYIDGSIDHIQLDSNGNPVMVKDHALPVRFADGSEAAGVELENEVPMGKRVENYRYVLYVDDMVQDFDPDTENPTHGNNTNMQREEFELPFTFHLHQGQNKIRLCMAGGYRSTFYNFYFRPYTAPTPITVDQDAITVEVGKTVQITSSMTGLIFSSAKSTIATVSESGLVTGVNVGTTTITVSKEGNYKSLKIPVNVTETQGVIVLGIDSGVGDNVTFRTSQNLNEQFNVIVDSWPSEAVLTYTFINDGVAGPYNMYIRCRASGGYSSTNVNELDSCMEFTVNGAVISASGYVSGSTFTDYLIGSVNLRSGENVVTIKCITEVPTMNLLRFVPVE